MNKRKKGDEINELTKQGRVRNRLLSASLLRKELRIAADRVMRLSEPGTPERMLTLIEVAEESNLSASKIVDDIVRRGSGEKEGRE